MYAVAETHVVCDVTTASPFLSCQVYIPSIIHRADPPYTQKRKLRRAPETPGGPLALKYVLILVLFLSLASGYENMNDHFFSFKAVHCHPLYVKISLLTKARDKKKKNELKA